jgi:hypothetical protein
MARQDECRVPLLRQSQPRKPAREALANVSTTAGETANEDLDFPSHAGDVIIRIDCGSGKNMGAAFGGSLELTEQQRRAPIRLATKYTYRYDAHLCCSLNS